MLQYSFTISLDFPTLLALFVATMVSATFIVRYRYLARYTQLKEPALRPSSPQATTELLPLSNAALQLNERSRNAPFHNYLDDFLAAIRIFGYLEKPVFHELSRHLQTRRLGAGETLEIGTGDFWCVVEGRVQVVSLLSRPRHTCQCNINNICHGGGAKADEILVCTLVEECYVGPTLT